MIDDNLLYNSKKHLAQPLSSRAQADTSANIKNSKKVVKIKITPDTKINKAQAELDMQNDQDSNGSPEFQKDHGFSKTFPGIPDHWHETIQVKNKQT